VTGATVVVEQDGQVWAWTAVEIKAAYDLTRRADANRLDPAHRLAAAVREQAAYLDRLLAVQPGEVVALRIVRVRPNALRMFLIGRVAGTQAEAAVIRARQLAGRLADVPSHVQVAPVVDPAELTTVLSPFEPVRSGIGQIGKRLRVHTSVRPDAGVAAYLAVEPFARHVEPWTPLLEALRAYPHPVSVTVALSPLPVPVALRTTLEREATRYGRLREPRVAIGDTGARIQYPADSAATILHPLFIDALNRYTDRAFQFAITVASSHPLDTVVLEAVGRTISPATSDDRTRHDPNNVPTGYAVLLPRTPEEFELLCNAHRTVESVSLADLELDHEVQVDAGADRRALMVLRTLVDRAEAPSILRLPIAADGNVPGFPVAAPPDVHRVVRTVSGPSLVIGHQGSDLGAEVRLPLRDLPRHGFIVGTPGSGKTNTALHMCRQLWLHGVPFMVIEPVNSELNDYRWLANQPGFDDLLILTAGNESVAPLRLNPFEVPLGASVSSHIANLVSCFEAAFALWEPLPFIYRRALVRAYRLRGLHAEDRGTTELAARWPTLPEFVASVAEVSKELKYSGEVADNIDAAARVRVESLAEGACGSTLDCRRSYDIGELLRRPVVVELAGVGDNAKEQALVTLLLMTAIRGHRRSTRRAEPHVLVVEEAHRVFPRDVRNGDRWMGNPQALAAERIAQGLAEDRKYGQSYILIDQQVGKVAEDAYKITNLKVMHRSSAQADRELLGSTMSLHPDQVNAAAALEPFQALISHNGLDRAVTVVVPNVRGIDAAERGLDEAPLADNEDVRAAFVAHAGQPWIAGALAPFDECHECQHRCLFRRHAGSVIADGAIGRKLAYLKLSGGGWPAAVDELRRLAGDLPHADSVQAREDYRTCVFIHAMRAAYPPHKQDDEGRGRTVRWAEQCRAALREHPTEPDPAEDSAPVEPPEDAPAPDWEVPNPEAEARAPFVECEGCQHVCLFRSQASAVADTQKLTEIQNRLEAYPDASADQTEWWQETATWVRSFAGSAPLEAPSSAERHDYEACVFVHLCRNAWKRNTLPWVRLFRKETADPQ
jgi:hypothetical protein